MCIRDRLTKKHEEKVQTTFSELLERSRTQEPRGEYVLVICGRNVAEIAKEQQESWEAMPLEAHMADVYKRQECVR